MTRARRPTKAHLAGTIAAAAAVALAAAVCNSPMAPTADDAAATQPGGATTVVAPASGGAWRHQPSGFVSITDAPWSALTGWSRRASSRDRIVADLSAPLSPPDVLEYLYPSGFAGGTAPATHYVPLSRNREIFVGVVWKISDPWQGHSSGVNKLQFLYLEGGADIAMVMYGGRNGPYDLRVLPQWAEHNGSWLTPNAASRPVTPGRWHRAEWYLRYETRAGAGDGIVRWWLDGELVGNYTNVRYPRDAGFIEYQLSPTWGGVGDTKTQHDFYRFDHAYLSAPSS